MFKMKSLLIIGAAALVYAQADSTGYFPGEPSCAVSDKLRSSDLDGARLTSTLPAI